MVNCDLPTWPIFKLFAEWGRTDGAGVQPIQKCTSCAFSVLKLAWSFNGFSFEQKMQIFLSMDKEDTCFNTPNCSWGMEMLHFIGGNEVFGSTL